MSKKYQLFEKLSPEEYSALEADIVARGIQVSVDYDENGEILDGHHRVEIAEKHGIEIPYQTKRFKTEGEKREHVIKVNLARRHLAPHQWGQAFKMLLEVRGVKLGKGGDRKSTATITVDIVGIGMKSGLKKSLRRDRILTAGRGTPAEERPGL